MLYSTVAQTNDPKMYWFKTITAFILLTNLRFRQGSVGTSCLYSESAMVAQRLDAGTI